VKQKNGPPNRRRSFFLPISIAITALVFLSCSNSSDPSKNLLVYTSVPESFIKEICAEFSTLNKRINIKYVRSASEAIVTKFKTESASGAPSADVVWVADFALGESLKKAGLLLRYKSPEASKILPQLKDPDGFYCAARLLSMVLVYNTNKLPNPPRSYKDLLNPSYRGKIGIADPDQSGASLYAITALSQDANLGPSFVEAMRKNGLVVVKDNETLIKSVVDGSLWLGLGLDYLVRSTNVSAPGAAVDFAIPTEGAVLVPSPIAMAAGSANPEAGKTFIDFILSARGQRLISSQGVAPVRLDVIPPGGIPTITQMRILEADPSAILEAKDRVAKAFREFFTQ
jgi:iron(III) transport system substrate-binding protein